MNIMRHQGDIVFGAVGTAGTLSLTQWNAYIAFACGVLTFVILVFRLRREWKHRDKPPTRKDED